MNAAEMLARDLVLRVCASDGEFRRDWLTGGVGGASHKRVVPLAVAPGFDPELADAIAGAAAELGADRLLACRTRAAYMYDNVTVLPANGKALLDLAARWGQPDDFLVCLPDGSAAVLVAVAGYALGAGPPLFAAALAGPDVASARDRFAAWARDSGDQRLRLVAGRYGGGQNSRHASRTGLRPDVPERLSALAADFRRRPARTAVLRLCRTAVCWAAVAVIVITLLSAPRATHVLPVLAGTLWLVFQAFALARTHTLSWAACLRMMAAGAVLAAAIAAIEWLLAGHVPAFAGPAEEVAALLPVAAFWLAARQRFTRFAAADYALLGVAAGAGFALVQGTIAALAAPGTGWHLGALLPGWIDAGSVRFPGHAVTTGLVTASVGLAVAARPHGADGAGAKWRLWRMLVWLVPLALLGLAMLDHYHYGAAAAGGGVPSWVSRLHAAIGDGHATRWLLLAVLAVAVVVDFRAQRTVVGGVPPLPGVLRWAGLARAARGSVIMARLRHPARTRRGRLARQLAGLRVAAAETYVALCHEIAFLLVVVRWRPGRPRGVFAASLAFARQRRELAMREARAYGRVRRDVPPRAGVWAAWRGLAATIAVGSGTAFAAVLPLSVRDGGRLPRLAAAPGPGGRLRAARQLGTAPRLHPALQVRGAPPPHGGDLANSIGALHAWFSQFITAGQVLIAIAGLSVLVLLVSGWSAQPPLPSGRGSRPRGRGLRAIVGRVTIPAPGQVVLGVARIGAVALPPNTAALLRGRPVARPYQRLPPVQQALSSAVAAPASPQSAAVEAPTTASRRKSRGDELGRSGWLFPQDRVRRWLGHAPEFGVGPAAASAETADLAKLAAELTTALRQIAEAPGSLRFDDVIFRNHPARAVVDRATGAAVFFTPAGEFTGCALLTEEQLFRLVMELRL